MDGNGTAIVSIADIPIWPKNDKNLIATNLRKRHSPCTDLIDNRNQARQRMAGIFTSFAVLAVIVACLGLFGLSAFMAEQRSKEIGVRKVLGATASSITALMSKDFVKLVIIAILIASPIAWWAMSKWLQDFAYRVSIDWWIFVLAGGTAVVIALFTVSFQSVKAAMSNPVNSLRSE